MTFSCQAAAEYGYEFKEKRVSLLSCSLLLLISHTDPDLSQLSLQSKQSNSISIPNYLPPKRGWHEDAFAFMLTYGTVLRCCLLPYLAITAPTMFWQKAAIELGQSTESRSDKLNHYKGYCASLEPLAGTARRVGLALPDSRTQYTRAIGEEPSSSTSTPCNRKSSKLRRSQAPALKRWVPPCQYRLGAPCARSHALPVPFPARPVQAALHPADIKAWTWKSRVSNVIRHTSSSEPRTHSERIPNGALLHP